LCFFLKFKPTKKKKKKKKKRGAGDWTGYSIRRVLTVYFCNEVFVLFTYRFMVPFSLSTPLPLYFTLYLAPLFFRTIPRYYFTDSTSLAKYYECPFFYILKKKLRLSGAIEASYLYSCFQNDRPSIRNYSHGRTLDGLWTLWAKSLEQWWTPVSRCTIYDGLLTFDLLARFQFATPPKRQYVYFWNCGLSLWKQL